MHATDVIKKPLVTEKTTFGSAEQNRFGFVVDRRATKQQIKRAVEELYKVRVLAVATRNRPGKLRRHRFGFINTPPSKHAIVKVHPDDRIELF